MELLICNTLSKTPITANFLYKIIEIYEPKFPLLTTGIEKIFKNNIIKIVISNLIFHQLPWLICFIFLLIILWSTKVISWYTFLGLLIFSIFIVVISIFIYLYSIYDTLENLIHDTKVQLKLNLNKFKNSAF